MCDVTGDHGAETVRISVGSTAWELELSDVGRKQLDEALLPFVAVARPVTAPAQVMATDPGDPGINARPRRAKRTVTAASAATGSTSLTATERRACRAWARKFPKKVDGAQVADSGAIPASVVDRWIVAGRPVLT